MFRTCNVKSYIGKHGLQLMPGLTRQRRITVHWQWHGANGADVNLTRPVVNANTNQHEASEGWLVCGLAGCNRGSPSYVLEVRASLMLCKTLGQKI